jgi:hypothetical protein
LILETPSPHKHSKSGACPANDKQLRALS